MHETLSIAETVLDSSLFEPQLTLSPLPTLGVNLLNGQLVAIKFVRASLFHEPPPADIRQEPRKSDAPQLRDEFRSYRLLNGTRK